MCSQEASNCNLDDQIKKLKAVIGEKEKEILEQQKIVTSKDLEINQLKESFSKEKDEIQNEVGWGRNNDTNRNIIHSFYEKRDPCNKIINIVCLDHLQGHEDITHLLVSLILVGYQMFKLIVGMGSIPSCTNTLGHNISEEKFILLFENGKHFGQDEKPLTLKSHSTFAYSYLI